MIATPHNPLEWLIAVFFFMPLFTYAVAWWTGVVKSVGKLFS